MSPHECPHWLIDAFCNLFMMRQFNKEKAGTNQILLSSRLYVIESSEVRSDRVSP